VARSSFSPLVNRNSIMKRVLKMNPSVAKNAGITVATAAMATELRARCSQRFVLNVEPRPRYLSDL
jgi:hypothetical protein